VHNPLSLRLTRDARARIFGQVLINAVTGKVTPSTLTRLGSCPCESVFSDATAGGEIAFTSG